MSILQVLVPLEWFHNEEESAFIFKEIMLCILYMTIFFISQTFHHDLNVLSWFYLFHWIDVSIIKEFFFFFNLPTYLLTIIVLFSKHDVIQLSKVNNRGRCKHKLKDLFRNCEPFYNKMNFFIILIRRIYFWYKDVDVFEFSFIFFMKD